MTLILFDDHSWDMLLPLTFTRPVSALRVGIMTIAEKWEHDLGMKSSPLTRAYLQANFPVKKQMTSSISMAHFCPKMELLKLSRTCRKTRQW